MDAEALEDECQGPLPTGRDVQHRARILIVDDDRAVCRIIRRLLAPRYQVIAAPDGLLGLQRFLDVQPDLVLLDVNMPGIDGWEVLRRIREWSDTPIIMLTADDGVDAVIRALRGGADDYVMKPFTVETLEARVQAMFDRVTRDRERRFEAGRIRLDGGRLVLDLTRAQVQKDDRIIVLSATEHRLLALLAVRSDVLVPVSEILTHVWGPAYTQEQDNVKSYVRLLRRKIEDDPSSPRYLIARRGRGYVLVSSPAR